jgi:hypothetical protein
MAYSGKTVHLDPRRIGRRSAPVPRNTGTSATLLIDEQGWKFIEGKVGQASTSSSPGQEFKPDLPGPGNPVRATAVSWWVRTSGARGALIDENGNSTFVPPPVLKTRTASYSVKMPEVDPTVQPISTIGNRWWAPESEPEPEPEPAPVIPIRLRPEDDHDAEGRVIRWPGPHLLRRGITSPRS